MEDFKKNGSCLSNSQIFFVCCDKHYRHFCNETFLPKIFGIAIGDRSEQSILQRFVIPSRVSRTAVFFGRQETITRSWRFRRNSSMSSRKARHGPTGQMVGSEASF